ncbi:MAG: PmbA/TldA family metallopeptidase [Vicinamibacterales bacterium]
MSSFSSSSQGAGTSQGGAVVTEGTTLLSRQQAEALADRILGMSAADQTRVTIASSRRGNTRFADASISTSGEIEDTSVTVTATTGRRRASATTNTLDEASLRRTVDLAAHLARLAPEDPELMPELGPQTYTAVAAFVGRTEDLDPEARATAVRRAVDSVNAAGKAAASSSALDSWRPTPVSSPLRRARGFSPITERPMPIFR